MGSEERLDEISMEEPRRGTAAGSSSTKTLLQQQLWEVRGLSFCAIGLIRRS